MAIIDSFEEWQAHEQRLAELTAAETAQRERVLAATGPFRAAEETYGRRVREALLSGEEPPPPPEQPDLGGDAWGPGVFAQARAAHAAEGQRLRAQLAPQIEDLAAEAEEALRRRVTEDVLPLMEAILIDYRAMLAEVLEVRWAGESQRTERIRPSVAERTRSVITAADVLEAASTDVSLLDPDPLPGRQRPADGRVVVDHSPPEPPRRLGLSPVQPFGQRPEDPPRTSRTGGVTYI